VDQPLSAAQIATIEKRFTETVRREMEQVNLRKYAIQVALDTKAPDVLAAAQQIYDFVSKPMNGITVRVEGI